MHRETQCFLRFLTREKITKISRHPAERRKNENRINKTSERYCSQINLLTRKERTHRLCTRGAMLEKFLGCPNELTDEQVEEILKIAFHPEAIGRAIEQFRESNETSFD